VPISPQGKTKVDKEFFVEKLHAMRDNFKEFYHFDKVYAEAKAPVKEENEKEGRGKKKSKLVTRKT
jgi:hypothetical protein